MVDLPKVLVGCPVSDEKGYCTGEYIKRVKSLTYKNYDIVLRDNSKHDAHFNLIKDKINVIRSRYFDDVRERVVNDRNFMRNIVLKGKYDYYLSLEQDIIPPKEVIEKLLSHNKSIVSGLYYTKRFIDTTSGEKARVLVPAFFLKKGSDTLLLHNKIKNNELLKIDGIGLGCLLIHRNVLNKVKFRYKKEINYYDDVCFSYDALKLGYEIFVDTRIKCRHVTDKDLEWEYIG